MSTPAPELATDAVTILSYFGTLIGAGIAAFLGYKLKKVPASQHDAVIAGVGMELGNKQLQSEMNEHLKSIAESLRILADRKQAGMEAKIDRLIDDLEERESRPRRT
jgi:hypothetical protein